MVKKGSTKAAASKSAKAPPAREKREKPEKPQASKEEVANQQRILNIFSAAFHEVLVSESFTATLQEVKQGLFDRDFAGAFGTEQKLEVYASRWSPTRALCYTSVLAGIRSHLEDIASHEAPNGDEIGPMPKALKILSVGGGAAEIVALGGLLRELEGVSAEITLLDSAPWGSVVSKLENSLITEPPLSKYANEAAKAANAPMLAPSRLSSRFMIQDILKLERPRLSETVGPSPCLITLFFTLNELFTSSGIGKTTRFLLELTSIVPLGSLLLVLDSPGSYSEATVGKDSKRYPMQWLLDKVLLGTENDPVEGRSWTKLESNDSAWFRLLDGLSYPIALENMRYQMHLYRADAAEA